MLHSTFNLIDMGLLLMLGGFLIAGVIRGFTDDFLSLFTWVGSFMITKLFFNPALHIAQMFITTPFFANVAAAAGLFIVCMIVFVALVKFLSGFVKRSIFGGVDRSLGLISGGVRGVLIATLLYTTALLFWKPGHLPPLLTDARFEPLLRQASHWVVNHLIPAEFIPKQIRLHLFDPAFQRSQPSADTLVEGLVQPKPARPSEKTSSDKL